VLIFLALMLLPSVAFLRPLRFVSATTHYMIASGVILFFAAAGMLTDFRRMRSLLSTALLAGALAGGLAIVEAVTGHGLFRQVIPGPLNIWQPIGNWGQDLPRAGLLRVHLGMNHPLALGGWLAMLLPLALARHASLNSGGKEDALRAGKKRSLLGILLILIGILLTWSFSAWAAAAAACFLALLHPKIRRPFLPLIVTAGLLFIFLAVWFLPGSGESFFEGGTKTEAIAHSVHRVKVLEATWAGLAANPLFGEGLEAEKIKGEAGTVGEWLAPREDVCNGYANLLLRHGLVGLAAFGLLVAAFLVYAARSALRGHTIEARILGWALFAMMIGQLVALWAVPWFIGQHQHFFWIMLAIGGRLSGLKEEVSAPFINGGNA
jgi:hypothetical protein